MTGGDGIALAALVISAGTVLLQIRSSVQQRRLQERLTLIEEERRRDEVATRFSATFARGGKRPRITLTNDGPTDARDLVVEIIRYPDHPGLVVALRDDQGTESDEVSFQELIVGQAVEIPIVENSKLKGGVVRLRIKSTTDAGISSCVIECNVRGYGRAFHIQ